MDGISLKDVSTWKFAALGIVLVFLNWYFLIGLFHELFGAFWLVAGLFISFGLLWGLFLIWGQFGLFSQPSKVEKSMKATRKPNSKTRKAMKYLRKNYGGIPISRKDSGTITQELLANGGSRFPTAINHAIEQGWAKKTPIGWSISPKPPKEIGSTSSPKSPKEIGDTPSQANAFAIFIYLLNRPHTVEGAVLQRAIRENIRETITLSPRT